MTGTLFQSPGEASPPLTESFFSHDGADGILPSETLSPNKTLYVQPENPPLTSRVSSDSEQAGLSNAAPRLSTAGSSQSQPGILPGVLDNVLTSALHSQSLNSPSPSFLPPSGTTLPAFNNSDTADQNAAGQSPGTTISQSSSTGNGNAPASTGTSSTGNTSGMDANTLSSISSPPSPNPTLAPRDHGQIEPLQIEQQSQPAAKTTTTLSLTESGDSGGSGGGTVWITATDPAADEAGDPGEFTVERDNNVGDLTIDFSVSGAATEGIDYDSIGTSITLPDGIYSETITITPVYDTEVEGDEDVTITLTGVSDANFTIGTDTDTVWISDDDSGGSGGSGGGTVWIEDYGAQAFEAGSQPAYMSVFRDGTEGDLTVSYTVSGSATADEDYVALPGSVTIPNGFSWTDTTIQPYHDSLVESDEDVTVTLTDVAAPYYIDGSQDTGTVWIVDEDSSGGSGGNVWITASDPVAAEPDDPGEFTVERDNNVGDLTVDFSVSGLATEGADYDNIGTSITLLDGVYSEVIPVTPIDDTDDEGDEDVTLTLTGVSDPNFTIGTDTDTVWIADDDSGGSGGNEPPTAVDDSYTALYNTELDITDPGVLENDDGDSLTATVILEPLNGMLTLNLDGSFTYVPDPGYLGSDSFTYVANDGTQDSNEATVSIEVAEYLVDIQLDSNNDGDITPADDPVEMDDPGMIMGVNDDDDNDNGVIDSDPNDSGFVDDDLKPANLRIETYQGNSLEGFQVQLDADPGVTIWDTQTKNYNLTYDEYDVPPVIFTYDPDGIARWQAPDGTWIDLPSEVYLEGTAPGTAIITLAFLDDMGMPAIADKAKARPVEVDIDTDSDNDGVISNAPPPNREDIIEDLGLLPGKLVNYNFNDTVQGNDPDLELGKLSYDAGGADLTGYKLLLNSGPNVKLWLTQGKDPLPDENNPNTSRYVWTIGNPNITIPTEFYIEGFILGREHISFSIYPPNTDLSGLELPGSIESDEIAVTVVPKARLHFVTFENEHEITADPPPTGNPTLYDTEHWLDDNLDGDTADAGDRQWPVAYTRSTGTTNSFLKLSAEIDLNTNWNGTAEIKADGPGSIDIPATTATVTNGTVTITNVSASSPFPTTVKHYDNFDLDWQISFDGGSTWKDFGTSSNDLYLTLDDPDPNPLYETVVYTGSHYSDGKDNPNDVVSAIWTEFDSPTVRRVDGVQLKYWDGGAATATDTAGLLKDANGQCGSWSEFLIDTIAAQGITGAQKILVLNSDQQVGQPLTYGILVKNWQFNGAGSSPGTAPYVYVVGTDAVDLMGAAGQGNANPPGRFYNHFIVKYNNQYYDPSYGNGPYASQAAWENASLDGFFKDLAGGGTVAKKNDPNVVETSFTVV